MIKFFLQHDIGKGLLAMAVERVTAGEAEAEYQNLVSDLVTPLLALEAHATPIREGQGPSQTQGVQEIASKIEPCAIAYASLKQCSYLKSKAAKKPDSAEGVSAVERVGLLSKRLDEAAAFAVLHELELNFTERMWLGRMLAAFFVSNPTGFFLLWLGVSNLKTPVFRLPGSGHLSLGLVCARV